MNDKCVIYTAFDYEPRPQFLQIHLDRLTQYANKIDCKLHVIDKRVNFINKRFIKILAYEHFQLSKYDKMLWVDADTIISSDSPNIFHEYSDVVFAARKLPSIGWDNHSDLLDLTTFSKLLTDKESEIEFKDIKDQYVSAGVMILTRDIINEFTITYRRVYSMLEKIYNMNHATTEHWGIFRDEFITNYIISKLKFEVTELSKKWNWMLGVCTDPMDPLSATAYITHFDVPDNIKGNVVSQYLRYSEKC